MANGSMPQPQPSSPVPPSGAPPASGPSVAGLLASFTGVLMRPAAFFESLRTQAGLGGPIVFAVVMGLVAGVIAAVYAIVGLGAMGGAAGGAIGAVAGMAAIIVYPIAAAIGCFIGGAIVHVVALIAGGKGSFEHSVRIAGYSAAVMPIGVAVSFIPLARTLPGLYGLYLVAIGIIALHLADRKKTFTVTAVLAAILVLFSIGAWFAGRAARSAAGDLQRQFGEGSEFQREMRKAAEDARKAAEEARKAREAQQK